MVLPSCFTLELMKAKQLERKNTEMSTGELIADV